MTSGWRKASYSNPSGNCVEVQVVSAAPGDGLDGLRAAHPGWTFWRGEHTRSYWAMPPAGGNLLSATTTAELGVIVRAAATGKAGVMTQDQRIAEKEARQ
jgi:Domain of unknown function (DUF397)